MEKVIRNQKGQFLKGVSFWKGRHHSFKTRAKLRKAHLGLTISEETRAKMRLANKKPNAGQFKKGIIPKNKGTGRPIEGDKECSICHKIFHYKIKAYKKGKYLTYVGREPKTCSKECRYLSAKKAMQGKSRPHMQGKNAYQWRGGISSIYKRIQRCSKYLETRNLCFKRDGYTCQICNNRGGELNADHYPISFAQIINVYNIKSLEQAMQCDLLWNLRNLRTLCVSCHKKTETYGRPLVKHKKLI